MNRSSTYCKVVRANLAHAPEISRVGRKSFSGAFADLFEDQQSLEEYLHRTYTVSRIQESLLKPNNKYFIAHNDAIPAGFAKMKQASPQRLLSESRQTELQKIYVLKEYHGSGIGQRLVETVIALAKEGGAEVLWLDVHVSNVKARKFYEKNGFTRIGDHSFVIGTQLFYYDVMALPVNS